MEWELKKFQETYVGYKKLSAYNINHSTMAEIAPRVADRSGRSLPTFTASARVVPHTARLGMHQQELRGQEPLGNQPVAGKSPRMFQANISGFPQIGGYPKMDVFSLVFFSGKSD